MQKYELQWESPSLPFYWNYHFSYVPYANRMLEGIMGFQEENLLALNSENVYSFYLDKSEILDNSKLSADFFLNDRLFNQWITIVQKTKENVDQFSWERELSIFTDCQLFNYINELEDVFHLAVSLHLVSQPHHTNSLKNTISLNSQDKIDVFGLATLPKKLPDVLLEQQEWYSICEKAMEITKIQTIEQMLFQHLEKWKYITAGDSKKPMTINTLRNRLRTDIANPTNVQDNLTAIKCIIQAQAIDEKVMQVFSREEQVIINRLSTISSIRFTTKALWMKLWYLLEVAVSEFFVRLNQPNASFMFLLDEPIERIRRGEDDRNTYMMVCKNKMFSLYYNGLEKFYKKIYFNMEDLTTIDAVRGDCGYSGECTGIVVKIDWNDNIEDKLQKITSKTILVVPQTTPAFMVAVGSCLAIVVDEGGITSHASIISRELKKISILNTHIGTKVFNDGDIILVHSSWTESYAKKIKVGRS